MAIPDDIKKQIYFQRALRQHIQGDVAKLAPVYTSKAQHTMAKNALGIDQGDDVTLEDYKTVYKTGWRARASYRMGLNKEKAEAYDLAKNRIHLLEAGVSPKILADLNELPNTNDQTMSALRNTEKTPLLIRAAAAMGSNSKEAKDYRTDKKTVELAYKTRKYAQAASAGDYRDSSFPDYRLLKNAEWTPTFFLSYLVPRGDKFWSSDFTAKRAHFWAQFAFDAGETKTKMANRGRKLLSYLPGVDLKPVVVERASPRYGWKQESALAIASFYFSHALPSALYSDAFIQERSDYFSRPVYRPLTDLGKARARIKEKIAKIEADAYDALMEQVNRDALGLPRNEAYHRKTHGNLFNAYWESARDAAHKNSEAIKFVDDNLLNGIRTVEGLIVEAGKTPQEIAALKSKLQTLKNVAKDTALIAEQKVHSQKAAMDALKNMYAVYAEGVVALNTLTEAQEAAFYKIPGRPSGSQRTKDAIKAKLGMDVVLNNHKTDAQHCMDDLNTSYALTLTHYNAQLWEKHQENNSEIARAILRKKDADAVEDAQAILDAYQIREVQTDLDMARENDKYKKKGKDLTKGFATSCGVFTGGAWALTIAGVIPGSLWWLILVSFIPCIVLAMHAIIMNWRSSINNMGDDFFKAKVKRAELSKAKERALQRQNDLRNGLVKFFVYTVGDSLKNFFSFFKESELSMKGWERTRKHAANYVTGVVWGLITLIGAVCLIYEIPALFMPNLFGHGTWYLLTHWAKDAMFAFGPNVGEIFIPLLFVGGYLGYLCFMVFGRLIREYSDKVIAQGDKLYDNYFDKLLLLSKINNKSNPTVSHYAKQSATLFGILFTALAGTSAVLDLAGIVAGDYGFGLGFMGSGGYVSAAAFITYGLILVCFYGLMDFYIQRSQASVLKSQAEVFGGQVDGLREDQLQNRDDLTGKRAVDISEIIRQKPKPGVFSRGFSAVFPRLFPVEPTGKLEKSRRRNAIANGGPAIAGGIPFSLAILGLALGSLGILPATMMYIAIGIAVFAGYCAAKGSYQANGVPEYAILLNNTEQVLLQHELTTLETVRDRNQNTQGYDAPQKARIADAAQALQRYDEYRQIRQDAPAEYIGFKDQNGNIPLSSYHNYTKAEKTKAAEFMVGYFEEHGKVFDLGNQEWRSMTVKGVVYTAEQVKGFVAATKQKGSHSQRCYNDLARSVTALNPVQMQQMSL